MEFAILFVIFFTTIIQSIFGVGVLLFGTPLMLLFGYDFQFSLTILLPISILINFFQLINKFNNIEFKFYRRLIIWTIPTIIFFLYYISASPINLNLIIGIFLIFISFNKNSHFIKNIIDFFLKFEFIYLIIIGIVHGITNLGGALLSTIIFSKNLSKERTRATIAISYLTFAVFQIATLIVLVGNNDFIRIDNIIYWFVGLLVFFIIEKLIYLKINEKMYHKYFSLFLLIIGLLLIIKN